MPNATVHTVKCGLKGSLGPDCNAVRTIDYSVLGVNHLYQNPVNKRTKECSVNSPDYGPFPSNAPVWCPAPFDPEGMLSSVMASVTCFIGLHFGHILVIFKGPRGEDFKLDNLLLNTYIIWTILGSIENASKQGSLYIQLHVYHIGCGRPSLFCNLFLC